MSTRAVLLHAGRCGSTLLGQMLGMHPDVHWAGETLNRYRPHRCRARPAGFDAFRALARAAAAARAPVHLESVKINYTHLDEVAGCDVRGLIDRLARIGFEPFVLLERRNYLRAVVSAAIGQRTGRWHRAPHEPPVSVPVAVDVAKPLAGDANAFSLMALLDEMDRNYRAARVALARCGRDWLHLRYEDDVAPDPGAACRRVAGALGLGAFAPAAPMAPTNPAPLAALITNLPEVAEYLEGSPYAGMLGG